MITTIDVAIRLIAFQFCEAYLWVEHRAFMGLLYLKDVELKKWFNHPRLKNRDYNAP